MSSVIFTSAQRIIAQILDWLQSSGQGKTANLVTDTFQPGIDNATSGGEGFTLVPGTNPLSVTVEGQGIAYDPVSNRIFISSSDVTLYNATNPTTTTNDGTGTFVLTPQSTGCVNVPLTGSTINYLWIDYLATTNVSAFTLNKITQAKIFYKSTDGYNIQVTTVNTPPDSNSIFLGTIDLTSVPSGIIPNSTISQTGRQYFNILPNIVPIKTPQTNRSDATTTYNPASSYTLEAHIKAVGTSPAGVSPTNPHALTLADLGVGTLDTVVGHRQLEHGIGGGSAAANAIIAGVPGTPYPTTSAMAASINIVNPGSDYLTIFQLLSTEFALINGTAYNVTEIFGAIPANANIFFPNVSGTYNVYYDSIVKAFSSTTSDISSDPTKLWLCTVTYTYVGSSPSDHNALSALTDRRRVGSSTHLLQRWLSSARPGSGVTAASSGEFGFNLSTNLLEYWDGSSWQQPVNSSSNSTVPTGTLLPFAGAAAPSGFLLANGSAVSRTTFASLFAVIGTTWGPGDGSTTFNVPNLVNNAPIGAGSIAPFGTTVGSQTQTPTEVGHTHNGPLHSHETPILWNSGPQIVIPFVPPFGTSGSVFNNSNGGTTSGVTNTFSYMNTNTDGNEATSSTTPTINPVSVVQPSVGVTYIIKF